MSADALLAIIAGRDTVGFFEVRCRRPNGGIAAREWFPVNDRKACLRFIAAKAPTLDVYIGAAPRATRQGGRSAIDRAWCLWADLDTSDALERLSVFTPRPSLVIRSGSGTNVHVWWRLTDPISPAWAERANRRLALHLGGDMKSTDAARILRPPGSLSHKHDPPVRVTITHQPNTVTSVAALVKDLPDPPTYRPMRTVRPDVDADDPLTGIAADRYYATLTGREITHGNVQCPFHGDGHERNPSMKMYDTTYHCFGCAQGGSIYEFAARLWGYSLPVRGADFLELRDRLSRELEIV